MRWMVLSCFGLIGGTFALIYWHSGPRAAGQSRLTMHQAAKPTCLSSAGPTVRGAGQSTNTKATVWAQSLLLPDAVVVREAISSAAGKLTVVDPLRPDAHCCLQSWPGI